MQELGHIAQEQIRLILEGDVPIGGEVQLSGRPDAPVEFGDRLTGDEMMVSAPHNEELARHTLDRVAPAAAHRRLRPLTAPQHAPTAPL